MKREQRSKDRSEEQINNLSILLAGILIYKHLPGTYNKPQTLEVEKTSRLRTHQDETFIPHRKL